MRKSAQSDQTATPFVLARYFSSPFVKRIVLSLLCLNIFATFSLAASTGFEMEQIVMYQPSDVLEERIPDSTKLSDYIKRLQDVCRRHFASATSPETLDIVVAVRPGKQSRIWFVSSGSSNSDAKRESLRKELEKVKPCEVASGSIAFAIEGKIAGGSGKKRTDTPMPAEWQKAAADHKGNLLIPDGILDLVWPHR